MNKTILGVVAAIIIVGGISFYGGTLYGKGNTQSGGFGRQGGQFVAGAAGARGARAAGGATLGSILSKDAGSMTVKMQDGSTKIVLFGTSTTISLSSVGSLNDLSVGTNVLVTGSSNSDGSVTARSVMVRPEGSQGGPQGGVAQ